MAAGDFLDLAQAAVRSAQGDVDDTAGDLARAKAAINEAHRVVCGDGYPYDFIEREGQWVTTGGSDVYTYAAIATGIGLTGATIREIVMLTNDTVGGYPLTSMDWEQLETTSSTTQESYEGQGTPQVWAKWHTRIRLYPKPEKAYTLGVKCLIQPNDMTLDADRPLTPQAFSFRLLVPYAAAVLLEQEGGAEAGADSDRRMNRYREGLRALREAHGTAKRPTFNLAPPTAFDHLDWGY